MPPNQPTPIDKQPVKSGNPTLKVLHLTDVHMDTQYTVGEEAQCGEPQCCRPFHDPTVGFIAKASSVEVFQCDKYLRHFRKSTLSVA